MRMLPPYCQNILNHTPLAPKKEVSVSLQLDINYTCTILHMYTVQVTVVTPSRGIPWSTVLPQNETKIGRALA